MGSDRLTKFKTYAKDKLKIKDVLIRMIKTFIQGFLGALAVTLPNSDLTSESVLKSLLIGAVSGGISAVMNLIVNMLKGE